MFTVPPVIMVRGCLHDCPRDFSPAFSLKTKWQAFKAVTRQFNIENLLEEQQKSLREFLGGHNMFVNLPTGFGKSLIFQCLPIAAVALFARP